MLSVFGPGGLTTVSAARDKIQSGDAGPLVIAESHRELGLDAPEIGALRAPLSDTHFAGTAVRSPPGAPSFDRGARGAFQFKTRTILSTRSGNKTVRVLTPDISHVAGDPPPSALAIVVEGRPVAYIQYEHERREGKWTVARSRTSVLDSSGTVKAVIDRDLSGVRVRDGSQTAASRGGANERLLRSATNVLRSLFAVDVVYAAVRHSDEEFSCVIEYAMMTAAAVIHAVAAAELAIALAACTTTIILCPAVLVAIAAILAADLILAEKVAAYNDCVNRTVTRPSGRGGGIEHPTEEEWCNYTIWFDEYGHFLYMVINYCWYE